MINFVRKQSVKYSAAIVAGVMIGSTDAYANNIGTTATNIGASAAGLPSLVNGTAYIMGTVIGALGILKIKDHVENPTQTPLKDGTIRLLAGGSLLATPFLFETITGTIANGQGAHVQGVAIPAAPF